MFPWPGSAKKKGDIDMIYSQVSVTVHEIKSIINFCFTELNKTFPNTNSEEVQINNNMSPSGKTLKEFIKVNIAKDFKMFFFLKP